METPVFSILFGVVATTSLSGILVLLLQLLAAGSDEPMGLAYAEAHPGAVVLINLVVGAIFAMIGALLYRRSSSN